MKIISKRERIHNVEHRLEFASLTTKGAGLSFPCDEHGNVDEARLSEAGKKNLAAGRAGDGYFTGRVETWTSSYVEPAVGECVRCKRHVTLSAFTNTCECLADYNMSGQLLASREQWGEETGEPWWECV